MCPPGGWSLPGIGASHLTEALNFLGAMTYSFPAWTVQGALAVMGDRGYINLLWGMNRSPADMEAEVPAAVRAGSATVGFWIGLRGVDGSKENRGFMTKGKDKPGGFAIEPGGLDAMARALGRAESDWFAFYRENLLTGDPRFVVTEARLGHEELTVTVKNLGHNAERRTQGAVDLSAIE